VVVVQLQLVPVELPENCNVIIGQTHFIKSVEDIYEAIVGAVPGAKFGVAFCEASGVRLVRSDGTDQNLVEAASRNATAIGAGHSFVVLLGNCYPINVLNAIKSVPEVCGKFRARIDKRDIEIWEFEGNDRATEILKAFNAKLGRSVQKEEEKRLSEWEIADFFERTNVFAKEQ
jgi:adenosine/AMP kinase